MDSIGWKWHPPHAAQGYIMNNLIERLIVNLVLNYECYMLALFILLSPFLLVISRKSGCACLAFLFGLDSVQSPHSTITQLSLADGNSPLGNSNASICARIMFARFLHTPPPFCAHGTQLVVLCRV